MAVKKTDLMRMRAGAKGRPGAQLRPIGKIRSILKTRGEAPRLGSEGAPDAWIEVSPFAAQGLDGLVVGNEIIVLTWLHRARRDVLKVYPRSDRRRPLTGVFATRSPDGLIRWAFIASPCAGLPGTGCGLAPSKLSTARRSLTSNRCFRASKTSKVNDSNSLRQS